MKKIPRGTNDFFFPYRGVKRFKRFNAVSAEDRLLEWARSQECYQRAVTGLVEKLGWPEEAARDVCDLTVLAKTRLGRRVIGAQQP